MSRRTVGDVVIMFGKPYVWTRNQAGDLERVPLAKLTDTLKQVVDAIAESRADT